MSRKFDRTKKSSVSHLCIIILVLFLCATKLGAAQEVRVPDHLSGPWSFYSPVQIGVRLSSVALQRYNCVVTREGGIPEWNRCSQTEEPDSQTVIMIWETGVSNKSNVWHIDVFVNYTVTVTQWVNYFLTSTDCRGLTLGTPTGGISVQLTAQSLWIRFDVATWPRWCPPTLEEEMAKIFQPGTPLMEREDKIDRDVAEIRTNTEITMGALVIVACLFVLFMWSRRGSGGE